VKSPIGFKGIRIGGAEMGLRRIRHTVELKDTPRRAA
jgi:hypothetical protein